MLDTIEKIVEGFPFQTINRVVGATTYKTISNVHLKLDSNAASVHFNLGNDALGLLYLTLSPAVYATLSAIPFDVPANPGSALVIPPGSTVEKITNLHCTLAAEETLFNGYDCTNKGLRQQLIGRIEKMCVRYLRHNYIGYGNISTWKILDHLYTMYDNIFPSDLQDNDAWLRTPYDENHLIENLRDQIEKAVSYAVAGQNPCTPAHIVAITYHLVFQTGLFLDDCKTWRQKDPSKKYLDQLKDFGGDCPPVMSGFSIHQCWCWLPNRQWYRILSGHSRCTFQSCHRYFQWSRSRCGTHRN